MPRANRRPHRPDEKKAPLRVPLRRTGERSVQLVVLPGLDAADRQAGLEAVLGQREGLHFAHRRAALAAATALPAQSGRFDLVIAATTDVHGRLRGWDDYANAADPARSVARSVAGAS